MKYKAKPSIKEVSHFKIPDILINNESQPMKIL